MKQSGTSASLVIMAAGLGSRFGQGIKQLTRFGPDGEIIMDYSIYDALKAGFDRVVFVIRKDLEEDFREIIGKRMEEKIDVAYAFQEKDDLPEGFSLPDGRKKPWGTGQAILACRDIIDEPFCVINADDYYGKKAFSLIRTWLGEQDFAKPGPMDICMAGFVLENTLSDHGGVTRGICRLDGAGKLIGIDETKNIIKVPDGAAAQTDDGIRALDKASLVSMNMWGFGPQFMDVLRGGFVSFLKEHIGSEDEMTAEYLLPTIVDDMLKKQKARVSVLATDDRWFGVTYQEDIPIVKESFLKLTQNGIYPQSLWKENV